MEVILVLIWQLDGGDEVTGFDRGHGSTMASPSPFSARQNAMERKETKST